MKPGSESEPQTLGNEGLAEGSARLPGFASLGEFLAHRKEAVTGALTEIQAVWRQVERIVGGVFTASLPGKPPATLAELRESRLALRLAFLETPVVRLERGRLMRRLILALETFDRRIEESLRSLPEEVEASWADFSEWLRLGRKASSQPRQVPLRQNVTDVLKAVEKTRSRLEGEIVFCVSESLSVIHGIWRSMTSRHLDPRAVLKHHEAYFSEVKVRASRAMQGLENHEAELSSGLPRAIWKQLGKNPSNARSARAKHFEHWGAQIRSGEGLLQLDRSSEQAWDFIFLELERLAGAIQAERGELLIELQGMADWLSLAVKTYEFEQVPASRARVVTSGRRQQELSAIVSQAAAGLLTNLPYLADRRPTPPSREKWIQLYPDESLRAAWSTVKDDCLEVLGESEADHRKMLQEVERARDVVRFAQELEPETETENGDSMVGQEALSNALELLLFQIDEEPRRRKDPGRDLMALLPDLFDEYQHRIGTSRAGAMAHLLGQSLRRGGRSARKSLALTTTTALRGALAGGAKRSQDFLAFIGFAHRVKTVSSMATRTYLPTQFVRKQHRDLPAIYQRLFRIEPVEDPRFLVGRSPETQAIMQARKLWQEGRSVSVLISGQRGSGKTSLLNCIAAELGNVDVIRGQFHDRLTTVDGLHAFLADLLGLDTPEALLETLQEKPRILIIEELERTFLRVIGGYEAIRALQALIAATCHSTLWILAINQVAYKHLNRVTGLSQRFTHRIQTASANRENLENAIMVRHNLSGLRLRFSARHEAPSRWRALQQRLTGAQPPQEQFFEALARQSAGVYRTALEMWQAHVETVEAGVVYLEPITIPDLGPIVDELEPDDLFTLVAILQHGSLKTAEHAQIFAGAEGASETSLRDLMSRELLEEDPIHPGLRIRPEAMPVVKEALFRRNLL